MSNQDIEQAQTNFEKPEPTTIYDKVAVKAALVSGEDSLLRVPPTISDESYEAFLRNFLTELLAKFGEVQSILRGKPYKFELSQDLSAISKETQSENSVLVHEVNILVEALKQALSLVYYNPTLRKLVERSLEMMQTRDPITKDELEQLRNLIENSGLSIIRFEHADGFNGNAKNHGTLVYDEKSNEVRLFADRSAYENLQGLIHEYAAYAILKTLNPNLTYSSVKEFEETKQKSVRYILLFIDMINTGKGFTVYSKYNKLVKED